jgi:hypothetical protein
MTTEEVQPGVRRRSVLKWIGLGAGATVVAAGTGIGVRAAVNGGFTAGTGAPYDLWREWATLSGVERVVAAGVLACNPHNTQPWVMVPGDGSIDLFSDPTRRMPVNDAADREHFAGLGCAVENMVVAAGATGFDATVTVFPEGTASDHVARIGLRPAPPRSDPLADAIPRRHTNRGPYTPVPVDTGAFAAARVEGAGVRWVTERGARDRLGALYVEATEAIVADTAQSEEAFSWFRNDRADIDRHRDGLTLDGQGFDGFTLFAAKVLPDQSRTDGDRFWVDATRNVHTATAAAYGVVTVADAFDRSAQVAGGRLLARLHLTATALGLGFHHMNQVTERIDRDRATGRPDVFSAPWSQVIGVSASTGLVSFRIGYPERAPGLSPRRALDATTR